jgi:PAS domain S-box-containing protein
MTRSRILVVEDESVVALDIQMRLSRLGYTVLAIVSFGEEAIRKAEELRPDLVLMDVQLKGAMDGVEAAAEIRARFDIPVIFLTAYTDETTLQRAKVTESYGYLLKPFKEAELRSTIEMALYKHQMERRLQASERWLSTTLRSIGDAVIATDAQGHVQFMNPVAEALTSWSQEHALGKDLDRVFNIIDRESKSPHDSLVNRVLQNEDVIYLKDNTLLIAQDGAEIPVDDSAAPIRDDKGEIIGIVVVFRDITERARADKAMRAAEAEARKRLHEQTILREAIALISSTLDLPTVLCRVAEQMAQAVGATSAYISTLDLEASTSTVLAEYYGPEASIEERVSDVGVTYREDVRFVERLQAREAHFAHVVDLNVHEALRSHYQEHGARSVAFIPLRLREETIGYAELWESRRQREFSPEELALCQTIAQHTAVAIENARLYEQAQQELTERVKAQEALKQHAAELQARNEELDAFAHTVAHDLKNPAHLMAGFAEVLHTDHTNFSNEELKDYLGIIVQNGYKMCNIIDELLILSGVRQTDTQPEPLDMVSIVANAQERLAFMIKDCEAQITLPDQWPVALGYGPWIEEVWVNYLSNGIKYGGRPPRLELGAKAMPDRTVCFWIKDNGPGLTPEEKAQLFTPFTQLDRIRANGHGLGLSIVKRIVEKLDGQVGVMSRPGRGSIFSFSLPGLVNEHSLGERCQS